MALLLLEDGAVHDTVTYVGCPLLVLTLVGLSGTAYTIMFVLDVYAV